jgi:uncharacterized protein
VETIHLSFELLAFLFGTAAIAAFLDTLAGGGGLLSLPALILSGLPPLFALGTNKLQGSMGTATATFMMLRKKRVVWKDVKLLMLAAFIGSTLGTCAVQFVDTAMLTFIIPAVLVVIAVYFLFSPLPSESVREPKIALTLYRNLVVPVIGWYDGMFGPGTGSFFALAGVTLQGQGLIQSTAVAKTLNFATNISSLLVFLLAGKVVWTAGLLMMAGQALGAWAGSHCLFIINPRYLRLLIVVMCLGMLVKFFFTLHG